MTDLTDLNIAEVREGLRKREFSALQLTNAYLSAIEMANGALNAYVHVTCDLARSMAMSSDDRLRRRDVRALEGIPLGLKDIFCTKNVSSQACSHVLKGFKPSYESTVSANLWHDGAVMLGKLNMDEFGMGSSNESSCYGPVINPYRAQGTTVPLTPGGSSGGSSAAVAARLCAGSIGTDTGGSIRQPGALTGVVGMKPTYGRCSRWGILAFVSSLDQAGPMAHTVRDCAIMLKSMAGYDPKDATSIDKPVEDYEQAMTGDIRGMTIGIPKEYRVESMQKEIGCIWERGITWLKDAGAEIIDVSLPYTACALPAYYILAPVEASSNLARYDGLKYGLRVDGHDVISTCENTRAAGFGKEVKRRILIGTHVLSAGYYDDYYLRARKVRTLVKNDFDEAFKKVDALLTPTSLSSAFPLGQVAKNPVQMYLNDSFTVPVNMAGLPAITVPVGVDGRGLPIGLQLISQAYDEGTLFKIAGVLESAAEDVPRPDVWW